MAKITIELDTSAGDTLQEMLAHLIVHHAPSAAFVSESVSSRLNPSVGNTMPTREEIVATGKTEDPAIEKLIKDRDYLVAAGKAMVEKFVANADATGVDVGPSPVTVVLRPVDALTEYDGDRKRGTAGPNGGRRTKAQIESDTLYFDQERNKQAAAATQGKDPNLTTTSINGDGVNPLKAEADAKATTALAAMDRAAALEKAAEASREEHRSLRHGEDDAQDAADEAAETAQRPADAEPTLEDLRKAYVRYSDKFGTPNAIRDVRTILGCGVNAVPADKIAEALAKMQAAMDAPDIDAHLKGLNTPGTTEKLPEVLPPTATKEELVDAMKAYAKLYDGSTKPDDMKFTKEDLPKVFTQVFGPGVTGMGSMPGALTGDFSKISRENFGKIVTAIKAATTGNLFKRTAVRS